MFTNKIICFDIDGVLTNEIEGHNYKERTLRKGIREKIIELKKKNTIILYTARHKEDKEITLKWLKDNKIDYDEIYFGKPLADIYIDDKALNFKR
jgi:uncharacterized HAD superfamily protein